jgi:ATP phosphoribosyltransferase
LRTEAADFPLEIYFLRDDDIPEYVADGVADIGIVGENVLAEDPKQVEVVERLGFGRCRILAELYVIRRGHPNPRKDENGSSRRFCVSL